MTVSPSIVTPATNPRIVWVSFELDPLPAPPRLLLLFALSALFLFALSLACWAEATVPIVSPRTAADRPTHRVFIIGVLPRETETGQTLSTRRARGRDGGNCGNSGAGPMSS